MFFPCSENKGADQLRGYREADLRLCFRICKKPVFSRRGSYNLDNENSWTFILMRHNTQSCNKKMTDIWVLIASVPDLCILVTFISTILIISLLFTRFYVFLVFSYENPLFLRNYPVHVVSSIRFRQANWLRIMMITGKYFRQSNL